MAVVRTMKQKTVVKGKTAFYLFLLVSVIVTITVWLTGLDIHRTISNNAFYSLTIITSIFFAFVTYGLYHGAGLQDDFGSLKKKIGFVEPSSGNFFHVPGGDLIGELASEGPAGIFVGILLWLGMLILSVLLAIFFETIVLAGLIIFAGTLYWIFYRATRLILRNARVTKGDLPKSVWVGFRYSLMYSGWIYVIIWITQVIRK